MPLWPLLLALAGTAASAAGAQKVQSTSNKRMSEELQRQAEFRRQAQQQAAANAQQVTRANADATQKQGAEKYVQAYNQAEQVPLATSQAQAPFARSESASYNLGEQSRNTSQNQQRANLQGFGEWDLKRQIQNLLTQQQLGLVNNFAQGSNNVLPLELQSASHAGDTLAGIGQLLSTAGMIGGLATSLPTSASTSVSTPVTWGDTGKAIVPTLGSGESMYVNALQNVKSPYFDFLSQTMRTP